MKCNPHSGSFRVIFSVIYQTEVRPSLLFLQAAESPLHLLSSTHKGEPCSIPCMRQYPCPPATKTCQMFSKTKFVSQAGALIKSLGNQKSCRIYQLPIFPFSSSPGLQRLALDSRSACSHFLGPMGEGTVTLATPPAPLPIDLAPTRRSSRFVFHLEPFAAHTHLSLFLSDTRPCKQASKSN